MYYISKEEHDRIIENLYKILGKSFDIDIKNQEKFYDKNRYIEFIKNIGKFIIKKEKFLNETNYYKNWYLLVIFAFLLFRYKFIEVIFVEKIYNSFILSFFNL